MVGMQGRRRLGLVLVQYAEAAGEGDLLLGRQVLAGEHEHDVLQPRVVDLLVLRVAERLAQVDAPDLGTCGEAQRRHGDGTHLLLFPRN